MGDLRSWTMHTIKTKIMKREQNLAESRSYWNDQASAFDDEPDHGLRDPVVRAAWTEFLATSILTPQSKILDIGCGTGSLSLVLAEMGHTVTGIDLAPEMIRLAREKAQNAGHTIDFQVMEATSITLEANQFDVLICRHLLWALPNPQNVLQTWAKLLKLNGRLILIEGYWDAGGGLHAQEIISLLPKVYHLCAHHNLSKNPNYWGKSVSDERYAIIADTKPS